MTDHMFNDITLGDFPGPVVKISTSSAEGVGLIPGRATKISHASRPKNQSIKTQKQYYNEFNKNVKNGPHKKSLMKKDTFLFFLVTTNSLRVQAHTVL